MRQFPGFEGGKCKLTDTSYPYHPKKRKSNGKTWWEKQHEEKQAEKPKSLFICGHCGKEDKKHIQKVILAGYADMLCFSCKALLEDEVAGIARSFLGS